MSEQDNIKKHYIKTIYEWVKQNFGESEADDPSWSIEALADELSKAKTSCYVHAQVDHAYRVETCREIAAEDDIELTDEEVNQVVKMVENDEMYVDTRPTDMYEHYIDLVKGD